jgi:hypothetical protein
VTEEFYLVPANALGRDVMLKCDFAKNRLGFILAQSLSLPKDRPAQAAAQPAQGAAQAMVAQAYPGFGVTLTDGAK